MATAYVVLPFLVFVINLFLAAQVARSDWRSFRHRVFALFLTATALWGFTIFGMRTSPGLDVAFYWERAALAVIPFSGILFYHFTLLFTGGKGGRRVLASIYGLGLLAGAVSLAGLSATGMQLKFYGYAPILGPGFLLTMVASYLSTFMGLGVLVRALRRSRDPDEKNRIAYIGVGVGILLVGGTTDYLPALGVTIYPLGIISLVGFGVMATVAVTRYRLLDLRLVLRRGFAYSLLSSGIFAVYGLIFWLFQALLPQRATTASVVATVAAIALVTIAIPPAAARAQRAVDRLFFRERYDHLQALGRLAGETWDIGDFVGLADSLVRTTTLAMQAHWVALLLPGPEGPELRPVEGVARGAAPPLAVRPSSALARWLERSSQPLQVEDLELDPYLQSIGDEEREALVRSGARLFVGLVSNRRLTGVLVLGPKLTEEGYSQDDMDLLGTVAAQAATIIENSRLYSQEMTRLRELERLEHLKSSLLRTVSHELKSPVTAIRASVDLFSDLRERLDTASTERLLKTLRSGVDRLDRLDRLVQESLDYAQMQTAQLELHLEPTDLRGLAQEVAGMLLPTMVSRQQTLKLDLPEDLPAPLMDPQRIERVLTNLMSNASKFTPSGGAISLSARAEGSRVTISVSDTGLGIPEEDQGHLFTEYYRGSNPDGLRNAGTGLGLAIAKYLTEMHGGSISVRSRLGEGTTFTLTLPLVPMAERQPASEGSSPQS